MVSCNLFVLERLDYVSFVNLTPLNSDNEDITVELLVKMKLFQ
jgi:hypothetical protein